MSGFKALCIGVSQTGKSTFAFHKVLETGKQVIVWDANEVFIDVVKQPVSDPDDLRDALEGKEPVIVYDATGYDVQERFDEFVRFANVLEDFDGHSLLVDEAGDVQRATQPNPGMDRLYRRAGRRNNDIVETTHRPSQVATLNRALTLDTYLFAISRRADVKILANEFSEEAAEAAAQLPDYVYVHYHNRTGQFEIINDPEEWYVDLSKPLPERKRIPALRNKNRRPLYEENEYA